MDILLPILAGTLPDGGNYCFVSWQQLLVDFSNNQTALLANGRSYYNIGPTKPAPEFQAYPWLNTNDNRWYVFNGVWRSPNNYNTNERRLWVGDLTQLVTYDGGTAGTVSPTTGPMWIEATEFQGRSPMGVGNIPSTTGPVAITVTQQYGVGEYTLTDANGAVGSHTHLFGLRNPSGDDAYFSMLGAPTTTPNYQSSYITGSNGVIIANQTTADLQTLKSGSGGAGNTPTPFSIVHPVVGTYIIKPSGRQYYTVP